MDNLKNHRIYLKVFSVLSLLGVIDIASRKQIYEQYNLSDTGFISFYLTKFFSFISPVIGSVVGVLTSLLMSFTILWIAIAIFEYYRIKKISSKKETEPNQ